MAEMNKRKLELNERKNKSGKNWPYQKNEAVEKIKSCAIRSYKPTVHNYFALSHLYNMTKFSAPPTYKFNMRWVCVKLPPMKISWHCVCVCVLKCPKLDLSIGRTRLQSMWNVLFPFCVVVVVIFLLLLCFNRCWFGLSVINRQNVARAF